MDQLDHKTEHRLAFEGDRVLYLMKCLAPDSKERAPWTRQLQRHVDHYFTFAALHDCYLRAYGPIPLTIKTGYRGGRDEQQPFTMLCALNRTYIWDAFETFRDSAQTREFALVLNMPSVKGGVVMHTYSEAAHALCDTVIKCTNHLWFGDERLIETVTMQPYHSFAKWVAGKWRAGKPLRIEAEGEDVAEMTRHLPASAVLLFLWLRDAWKASQAPDHLKFSRQQIVERTGLSLNTVANSLKALNKVGLIEAMRGEHCVLIRVL